MRKLLAVLVLAITVASTVGQHPVHAASFTLAWDSSQIQPFDILKWNLPWPLNDYEIGLQAVPTITGGNEFSWQPGATPSARQSVSIPLSLGDGSYTLSFGIRAYNYKLSTARTVFDKTLQLPLRSLAVPGPLLNINALSIPVFPLEGFGIPAELGITTGLSFSTSMMTQLQAVGLTPETTTLAFTRSGTQTLNLIKDSSSSGKVTLTRAAVGLLGAITVSLGLSVFGYSTPLRKEFASIPFNVASIATPMNVVVADYQSGSILLMVGGIGLATGIAGGIVMVAVLVLRSRTKTPSFATH